MKWFICEKYLYGDNVTISHMKVKVKSLSRVRLLVTPWTVAHQAPLSMGFSRQEYWIGLSFPSPGDLSNRDRTQVSRIAGRRFNNQEALVIFVQIIFFYHACLSLFYLVISTEKLFPFIGNLFCPFWLKVHNHSFLLILKCFFCITV